MIVPDLNLLLYSYDALSPFNAAAKSWWGEVMTERLALGIPWAVALGFVRLSTHSSVYENPLSPQEAIGIVNGWLGRSHVSLLIPGSRHLDILDQLLRAAGVGGNLVSDAHIAALAIEYQCELHSNDADFSRFPGLRWRNPLACRQGSNKKDKQ